MRRGKERSWVQTPEGEAALNREVGDLSDCYLTLQADYRLLVPFLSEWVINRARSRAALVRLTVFLDRLSLCLL